MRQMFISIGILLIGTIGSECAWSQADIILAPGRDPAAALYPVTELRLVRHPGEFHFVKIYGGQYMLTDYWYEEVEVDRRVYQRVDSAYFAPPGLPRTGTDRRLKKVFVEILGGEGLEFQQHWADIQPTSFTLVQDEPKQIRIRYGTASSKLLTALFDGYHVDIGCQQQARVVSDYNGVSQYLGDNKSLGLRSVTVSVYWETTPEGGVQGYLHNEIEATENPTWANQLKEQVLSRQLPE